MNFLQKNPLFQKLQDKSALEADTILLHKRNPKAKALSMKFFDNAKAQKEILYELLDHATEEEIVNNRSGVVKDKGKAPAPKPTAGAQPPAPEKKKPAVTPGKKSGNKKGRKRR
jgi:hypothetical protein